MVLTVSYQAGVKRALEIGYMLLIRILGFRVLNPYRPNWCGFN